MLIYNTDVMAMKYILNDSTHTRSGARLKINNKDYKPFK